MKARSRLLQGVMALLILVVLPAPVADALPTKRAAQGFSQIAGCISGADNVLVSLVVDESLSLSSTDPQALRVHGITTAIDSLEQLSAQVGASTNVEVSLSTFARSYATLAGWRELTEGTAEELRATAGKTLPARDAGDATDYRQALLGAKKDLDARQRQLDDPNACKLLLWFTDGALDVDADTELARQALCQVGGIADSVRADGIAVIALALFTPGAGVTNGQRDELRAVAEGRGESTSCGTAPIPSDSASGVYLPADDPAALQRLFAGAGALVAGATEVGTVSCPGPGCEEGTYRLKIDKGIAGARVLVQSAGEPRVEITSPSGQSLELTTGQTKSLDGAEVTYLTRGRLATINLGFDPFARNRGLWAIRPLSPSELSVYWFWGAALSLETSEVRAGATNDVVVRVLDQNEQPLPMNLYSGARARLQVGDQQVRARLTPEGVLRGRIELGTRELPASLPVTASLTVRSVPGKVKLGPISLRERLPVTLPPAYASVSPQTLDFGGLEGVGTATAELQLTGSQLGPTRACLTPSDLALPGEDAGTAPVTADTECVQLRAGETKAVTLRLSPESAADGIASGDVTFRLTAADGSEDLEVTVPAELEMARKVDEGTRWALVAALVALAVLVPAALIFLSNLLLARFTMTSMTRTASKPVHITPSGLRPTNGSALLEPEDFKNASFSGVHKSRRQPVGGSAITLRGRRILSFKEPIGIATGPGGHTLVSSTAPYRTTVSTEAPTALGEVDASFVLINEAGASAEGAEGTLVMVVPGTVDRQGIHDRAARMSSAPSWDKILADVAATAADRPTAGPQRSGRATTVEESLEPSAPDWDSSAASGEGSEAEAPPPRPWEQDTPASGTAKAAANVNSTSPRKRRRKERSTPPPPPATPPGDDDTLPPLPDFLK